jgi:hypothetical protein
MSNLRTGIAIVVAWALGVISAQLIYAGGMGMGAFAVLLIILCPLFVGLVATRWQFIPCILVNFMMLNEMLNIRSGTAANHLLPDEEWRDLVEVGVIALGVSVGWSLFFAWLMRLKRMDSAPVQKAAAREKHPFADD